MELNDLLETPMEQLSGGQRQRVHLARCLVQEPAALLLDEPNTFLDLRHQVEMSRLLRDLSRRGKIAVLMASHDLNLAGAISDRLILLHDGVVLATGAAREVLSSALVSEAYQVKLRAIATSDAGTPVVCPEFLLAETDQS